MSGTFCPLIIHKDFSHRVLVSGIQSQLGSLSAKGTHAAHAQLSFAPLDFSPFLFEGSWTILSYGEGRRGMVDE